MGLPCSCGVGCWSMGCVLNHSVPSEAPAGLPCRLPGHRHGALTIPVPSLQCGSLPCGQVALSLEPLPFRPGDANSSYSANPWGLPLPGLFWFSSRCGDGTQAHVHTGKCSIRAMPPFPGLLLRIPVCGNV